MEKCALCKINAPDKKNTHFLTDSIIRSCLNLGGSSEREKGFYFDLSNNTPFIPMNFQRNASSKLEDILGRQPNEHEIEKAKSIPFSVDYVFCTDCEKIFTEIENNFTSRILPKLRNASLDDKSELLFSEFVEIRLFFLLQIWRTSVCTDIYKIKPTQQDCLRKLLLNYATVDKSVLTDFPILVTYLQTIGEQKEYTRNLVGYTNDTKPNLLLMNDFVIRYFNDKDEIKFFDFYKLNNFDTFDNYVNFKEKTFKIRILNNSSRLEFISEFIKADRVKFTIQKFEDFFILYWFLVFGYYPPKQTIDEFKYKLLSNQNNEFLKYTQENISDLVKQFINDKIR